MSWTCALFTSPETFFRGPYLIDAGTVVTSKPGHRLLVAGVLKEKTLIDPPNVEMGYCRLEFTDAGPYKPDPFLRQAKAEFASPEFSSITGISGSPVYDVTAHALCGMVVRGSMTGNRCTILYMDIADVVRFLEAVSRGDETAYYTKPAPAYF